MLRVFLLLLIAACSVSCGSGTVVPSPVAPTSQPTSTPEIQPTAPVPAAPALRLPRLVMPESNRVKLVLDPRQELFTGRIEIAARVIESTDFFWLNAQELTVVRATVTSPAGKWDLEVFPQKNDFVGFRTPLPLPVGSVTIAIDYTGLTSSRETRGVFRQQEGDDWYLFSDFEPTDARRAFPCFDEPDSKVPWQLTLVIPEDLVALSNTPQQAIEQDPAGMHTVTFAKSKPMPSYLVAFAVGPFEFVNLGDSPSGIPVRIVTPRGRTGDARYAQEVTLPILSLVEEYFGMPYPYAKLDLVAIPLTVSFGAMENVGLVTYVQKMILANEANETLIFKRRYARVTIHELIHMWFGNMVTMGYWHDLWLNEGLTTWMTEKMVHRFRPQWGRDVAMVHRRARALRLDGLASARQIRQPINNADDIENAFDHITYSKGAAVMHMFETWLGAERFQRGVRNYLNTHAWQNASTKDFLEAISRVGGPGVHQAAATFLEQVGSPQITFALSCMKGSNPVLTMQQERYLPLGSKAERRHVWQVPVCVSYPVRKIRVRQCTLLSTPTDTLELSQAKGCPAWLLPNEGYTGYYRSALSTELIEGLLAKGKQQLTLVERVGLVDDVTALVKSGAIDSGVALRLAVRLAKDKNRHIVEGAVTIAREVDEIVPDDMTANYARYVRKVFGRRAAKLGWRSAPGESDDTIILRKHLLELVANQGGAKALTKQARVLAEKWLTDRKTVDRDLVNLVLNTAAQNGDQQLWTLFYEEAKRTSKRQDRLKLLRALSRFREPSLARRSLALALTDDFDIRESMVLVWGSLDHRTTRKLAYQFVRENLTTIANRAPEETRLELADVPAVQCDASLRREIETLFKPHVEAVPGGQRIFAQAMERMELCIAERKARASAVASFLRNY